MKNLTQVIIV